MTDKCAKILCGLAAAVTLVAAAVAQDATEAGDQDAALRNELDYIRLLQEMRMPDIAEEVISEVKAKFPEAAAKLKVAEIQGLLSQGKFDDVQKIIDAIKDKKSTEYWALVLAKADAYYAFGKYNDADKLYLAFFKEVPKPGPALVSFYRDSAYKYAQMLLYVGREKDGLVAYRRLFSVPLQEEVERQVMADMSELMIKLAPLEKKPADKTAMLKEAETYVDKLLWKQDVWFGKAIVFKAHIFMLRGDVTGAQELVENYMPQLKIIHDSLSQEDPDGSRGMLRMSPMPQCRYLLAVMLESEAMAEAKKDNADNAKILDLLLGAKNPSTKKRNGKGAFNHFINVFIRYPESQWASDSGERSEEVRRFIKERFKSDLRTPVTPEQMAKVRQMQFSGARLVFNQNQFKEAIEKYLTVLNQFPEVPESVSALGDLTISYIDDGAGKDAYSELMADTVAGYISERFCENAKLMKDAGDQLRRIGEHYGEMKLNNKKNETYALFFRDYPHHYAAGGLVMSFGEREFAAKNYSAAMAYYRKITETYTNSTSYYDALSRIAQIYREEGDTTNAISALKTYVDEVAARERPGHSLVVGTFKLAEMQREYGVSMLKVLDTNELASAEEKVQVQSTATSWLVQAVKGFTAVGKLLETPDKYQQSPDEKKLNEVMRETALFTKAICLTMLKVAKPEVQKKLRLGAILAFEQYVKAYPQGKYAAKAQLQVGTLYTINEDMENAQKALDKLAREYPESEEAKNSVPMLAAALIDMGLKGEGVAKYRQMFAAGGNYTESQYFAAAAALENAREFDMAIQAYDKVLSVTKELPYKAKSLLGKVRSQKGLKKYGEAHKIIDLFLKDKQLSKMQQFVEANMLLVDVASEEGKTEKNDQMRISLFNSAVDALKTVRAYSTPRDDKGKPLFPNQWTNEQRVRDAELRLMSGEVILRRLDAEKKLGLKEQAAKTRGECIVAFQGMLMSLDPNNEAMDPVFEKTYWHCIPLLLEHKANKDAQEDCEAYLKRFPNGKYATDVQTWLNQSKIGG